MAIRDWLGLTGPQQAIVPLAPEHKAVLGPGAYAMTYDAPLSSGRWDTPSGMKRAEAMSHANPWIDKAERMISGRASGLPWHLETPDGETVDDDSPPELRAIQQLLEGGEAGQITWRQRSAMTYRHMGVINVGAWYLDAIDANGIPTSILYLNPARLTPFQPSGILDAWVLDADLDGGRAARRLELDEVVLFVLDPPDFGYFGRGLVEVAEGKAALSKSVDRYATHTFASGGRRGSWIMPKGESTRLPDDVYDSLVASIRNVREAHDSAKRDIVTKAPLDVVPQSATAQELQAADIMRLSRDDLLVIWGVDVQDAGIPGGGGLSSGELRQQARQSTYENAVDPRVDVFIETAQLRLLDRWKAIGIEVQLVIDRPTWDDEKATYERAMLALSLPLRNFERREMVGYDPLGDPVLDNAVWLPAGISEAYMAPDADGKVVVVPEPVVTSVPPPLLNAGQPVPPLFPTKASLGRTRATVEKRQTPAMRKSVASVLADQKAEVLRLIRDKASHLASKPGDVRVVWNAKAWDKAMSRAIGAHATAITETVAAETKRTLGHLNPAKAEPTFLERVAEFVLQRGGERVVEINRTTFDAVTDVIKRVVGAATDEGLSIPDIADRLTDAVGSLTEWGDARAETIARTETMFAYNDAALGSYREYGVDQVDAIDGDNDPECAERDGQRFSLEDALAITDHPNGTLDWLPVV